jgi:hypothetical protein
MSGGADTVERVSSEPSEEESVTKPRSWPDVIERLNRHPKGEIRIRMGSPGSAQVTRVRLLAEWKHLEAHTIGSTLVLSLSPSGR